MRSAAGTLPDWLIVGVPKAGTTTLAEWLRSHPQVFVSGLKEVEFFDNRWERGLGWYAGHFAAAAPDQRAGEATPLYVYSDQALDRIRATLPGVRLVLLLREPVERLWSQFWFLRMLGAETRSLDRSIDLERRHPGRPPRGLPIGYLESSRYAGRLRALQARFPAEDQLVLFFDDLIADPLATWTRLCRHIGVDPALASPADFRSTNPTTVPRSIRLQWLLNRVGARVTAVRPEGRAARTLRRLKAWNAAGRRCPPVPEELRERLRPEFASDLAELSSLLDRPLPAAWQH